MAGMLSTYSNGGELRVKDGFSWARTLMARGAEWVRPLRNEYYDGDLNSLSPDGEIDLECRKGISSPYPVALVTARRRYAFCRSWRHIRADKEDMVELRYVKRGAFAISQMGHTVTVNSGQFVFTRSKVPFRWESLASDKTLTEYWFILLPPDFVHLHFPDGVPLDASLPSCPDHTLAMPTLLSLLCDQGGRLNRDVTDILFSALLNEAGGVARQQGAQAEPRKNISDQRIEEILAYIRLHLFNPDISLVSVANACGISSRYLCYLLKIKGISFSDLVWNERLNSARERLLALDAKHYTISEIAFMTGFKTAAHFSRLFRNHYECSPREYRTRNGGQSGAAIRDGEAIAMS